MASVYSHALHKVSVSLQKPSFKESRFSSSVLHFPYRKPHVSRFSVAAQFNGVVAESGLGKFGAEHSSVGVNPNQLVPPPKSKIGSPCFWFGVGVALKVLFSVAVSSSESYAKKRALQTMIQQMHTPKIIKETW